jgi:hypothetical protein
MVELAVAAGIRFQWCAEAIQASQVTVMDRSQFRGFIARRLQVVEPFQSAAVDSTQGVNLAMA